MSSSSLYSSYYQRLALHGTTSGEATTQDLPSSNTSTFGSSDHLPPLTPAPFSSSSGNSSSTAHVGGGNISGMIPPGIPPSDGFNQASSHHLSGSLSSATSHGQEGSHNISSHGAFSSSADNFKYPHHVMSSAAAAAASQHSHPTHYPHSSAAAAHHGYLANTGNGGGMFPYPGLSDHSHHYAKLNLQAS